MWSELIQDALCEMRRRYPAFPGVHGPRGLMETFAAQDRGEPGELADEQFVRLPGARLFAGEGCVIQPTTVISGDIVLGRNVFVGTHCLLRGPLFIGDNCVIGRGNEITRSIVLSGTRLGHTNVILDSVIGRDCWLAAFNGFCNFRLDDKPVSAFWNDMQYEPRDGGCGSVLGNRVRLGCNVTLLPGSSVAADYLIPGPAVIKQKEWDH